MSTLHDFLQDYLESARADLGGLNDRFVQEVPFSGRPFVEEILGHFAASLDIVELARQELVSRDAGHDALRRSADEAEIITVLAEDGTIQFESAALVPSFGYSETELVGRSVFDLIHPEDLGAVRHTFDEGLSRPGETVEFRLRFQHADGTWRRIHSTARSINGGGEAAGYVVHSYVIDPGTNATS